MLKAMGIEDEKIDQIIEAHGETVEALKKERDGYKTDADKLEEVSKELEELKAAPGDDYKDKYTKEHEDFEAYKAQVADEKAKAEKSSLYRSVLKDAGIDPKRIDAVLKVSDLSSVEVKDGKISNRDKLVESVKTDWADFVVETETKPAPVPNPPANNGGDNEPKSLREAMQQRYTDKS